MYRINHFGGVIEIETGKNIPECLENLDWQKFLEWEREGNTPIDMSAVG